MYKPLDTLWWYMLKTYFNCVYPQKQNHVNYFDYKNPLQNIFGWID